MSKIKILTLAIISLIITSCSSEKKKFPLNKKYWDTSDYANVTRTLKYGFENNAKLPTFDNPETRIIIEKYTNPQNYLVILDDNELGLKHRNKIGETFFYRWKDMSTVYSKRDRKDNFIYEKEMLAVYHFGLGLQQRYFKLGNDDILQGADKPDDAKGTINSNIGTLISNYQNYLDLINDENSLSESGKQIYSEGLIKYYTELINLYPKANYSSAKSKKKKKKEKSKSEIIINSLNEIIGLIEQNEK